MDIQITDRAPARRTTRMTADQRLRSYAKFIADSAPQTGLVGRDGYRLDDGETLAMARQLMYFFPEIYKVEYPPAVGRSILPLLGGVPIGAEQWNWRMFDQVGEARVINSGAEDLPKVDATGKEFIFPIKSIGNSFSLTIQEMRNAMLLGVDLDTTKAVAAREIQERTIDALMAGVSVAGTDPTTYGWQTFGTNQDVPVLNGAGVTGGTDLNGNWASNAASHPEYIQNDCQTIAQAVFKNTLGVHGNSQNGTRLTMVLPTPLFSLLENTRVAGNLNLITIMEYVLQHVPAIEEITHWGRLDSLGVVGSTAKSGNRIVAFHKNPSVVGVVIPQEFEMLPMQPFALRYDIPCHMRYGGVSWKRPLAAVYADGC